MSEFDVVAERPYIPPPGIPFRLFNYDWGRVIYSSLNKEWQTGTTWEGTVEDDQWFTLEPVPITSLGTKQKEYWVIKSRLTGYYLKADIAGNGWGSHCRDIEPACYVHLRKHKHAGWHNYCRIIFTHYIEDGRTGTYDLIGGVLRCNNEGFWTPKYKYDTLGTDTYWRLSYEDMEIDRVEWDKENRTINNEVPEVLDSCELKNESDVVQDLNIDFSKTVSHETSYTKGYGISVKTTTTAGVAIPGAIFKLDTQMEYGASFNSSWGEKDVTTKTYTYKQIFHAPPWSLHRAYMRVATGTLDVPFTVYYKSPSTGVTCSTKGVWRGALTWHMRVGVKKVKEYKKKEFVQTDADEEEKEFKGWSSASKAVSGLLSNLPITIGAPTQDPPVVDDDFDLPPPRPAQPPMNEDEKFTAEDLEPKAEQSAAEIR